MIPTFPEFKIVEVGDREVVESHTHRYPPYSDFNFTSLWAWDISNERMISELNGNLVVHFTDYATNEPFLSFLGTNKTNDTALTLFEYAAAHGLPPHLKLMPEVSVKEMDAQKFRIEEDRDNFDYIYAINDLIILKGGKLGRKRTTISKFVRENSGAHVEAIDLNNREAQKNVLKIVRAWEQSKTAGDKKVEADHEISAITRLCETSNTHKILVSGLFSGENMFGFSIEEALPGSYCICHFWKVDSIHNGTFDFLMREKAKHFETLGIKYFNFEQDLGVAGLRQSKGSYGPHSYLKKFIVVSH